jgi:hypothetical protein
MQKMAMMSCGSGDPPYSSTTTAQESGTRRVSEELESARLESAFHLDPKNLTFDSLSFFLSCLWSMHHSEMTRHSSLEAIC